jgi:hypothetical protein
MARKPAKSKRSAAATQVVGEDVLTTLVVGEEGHALTTLIVGEEHHLTTLIAGEEHPTTFVVAGEEHSPPTVYFAEEPTKVQAEQTPILNVTPPAGTGGVKAKRVKAKRKSRR